MKTYLALLMMTEGKPVMDIPALGKLMGLEPRTVQNKIYAKTFPIRTFKLDGSVVAHVEDVAKYIDEQREAAAKRSDLHDSRAT